MGGSAEWTGENVYCIGISICEYLAWSCSGTMIL